MNRPIDSDRNDELGLVELVRILLEYRYVLAAATVACVLVAVVVALTATPIYRAEVKVVAADDRGDDSSLSSLMSGVPGLGGLKALAGRSNDKLAEAIETLKSQQFTNEFIAENELLPILFADKWDDETSAWDVEDPQQVPSLADGYVLFENEVRRVVEEDDGIVAVVVEWRDPALASGWANALIDKLNRRMRLQAIEEADRTIEFLEQELSRTNVVELRQAIYSMMENQLNTRTIASVRDEYAFKVISPALPPEADRFVRPQRMFMVALGGIIGISFGIFLSFLLYGIKRIRRGLA